MVLVDGLLTGDSKLRGGAHYFMERLMAIEKRIGVIDSLIVLAKEKAEIEEEDMPFKVLAEGAEGKDDQLRR